MKHCYGHEQLDPCEYCGTPLVGADYDDDYYVFPGILKEACRQARSLRLFLTVYEPENGYRLVCGHGNKTKGINCTEETFKFYVSEEYSVKDLRKNIGDWNFCPECGTEIVFETYYCSSMLNFKGNCPEKGKNDEIERLTGCEKCHSSTHGSFL